MVDEDEQKQDEWIYPWPKPADEELPQPKDKTLEEKINDLVPLPPEFEGDSHFDHLRNMAHALSFRQVMVRIAENPELSTQEQSLGFFEELLEPQVRTAVININEKGYSTVNSGFGINNVQYIYLQNPQVDEKTKRSLEEKGVRVIPKRDGEKEVTSIEFDMQDSDTLETLQAKWNGITELIPANKGAKPAVKRNEVITRTNDMRGITRNPNLKERRRELFDLVEEGSNVDYFFPRYFDIRGKLKRLVLG